jgi:hypothetical protein
LGLGGQLPHSADYYDYDPGDKICWQESRSEFYEIRQTHATHIYQNQLACVFPTYAEIIESFHEHWTPFPSYTSTYNPPNTHTPACDTTAIFPDPLLELLPYEHNPVDSNFTFPLWIQQGFRINDLHSDRISASFVSMDNYIPCEEYQFAFESGWNKTMMEGLGVFSVDYHFSYALSRTGRVYSYTKGNEIFGVCEDLRALEIDPAIALGIKISPNPASHFVEIKMANVAAQDQVVVTLIDAAGKSILRRVLLRPSDAMQLDLQDVPSGLYLLEMTLGDQAPIRRKLVIAR